MQLRILGSRKKIPDAQLIRAIREGLENPDPYLEYLYEHNRATIRKYIRANGGDQEEADEVLHAGVIKVFEQIMDGKFRGESALSSYLVRICKNEWIDRKKRAGNRLRSDIETAAQVPQPEDDPLSFMENIDIAAKVRELLQAIDEGCRKLLIWTDGEGRPMKWVAQELNYSLQAAMNKKSKCRTAMRDKVRTNPKFQRLLNEIMAQD
jgi:RNA polymerase sigma factor (sigma-70 family)